MIIAFLGAWFGHQMYTSASFNASDQSKAYSNLFQQAWNTVDQNYVDRKAVNYQQMSDGGNTRHARCSTRYRTYAFSHTARCTIRKSAVKW